MRARVRLAILFSLAAFAPVLADELPPKAADPIQPPLTEEQRTLESFGAQNKACVEWSDGCAVCVRKGGDMMACSLPGIACEPSSLACRTEAKAEPKSDKPEK